MAAVVLGWVIFRAPDISSAAGYLSGMFSVSMLSAPSCSRMPIVVIALLMLAEWRMKDSPHPFQWRASGWQGSQLVRMAVYLTVFVATIVLGGEKTQFIYFQF